MTANGYRGTLLGMMKMFWNQMPVMASQLCEYTKNQWTVHFTRVSLCYMNYISIFKNRKPLTKSVWLPFISSLACSLVLQSVSLNCENDLINLQGLAVLLMKRYGPHQEKMPCFVRHLTKLGTTKLVVTSYGGRFCSLLSHGIILPLVKEDSFAIGFQVRQEISLQWNVYI